MTRFEPPKPETYSADQTPVAERIASGPRGGLRGPLAMWLHRPQMAEHAQALGAYCRYSSSLPARLSELAILITAVHWQADYEWAAHEPAAHKAGLSGAVIEALRKGHMPAFSNDDEAAVYHFATELLKNRAVADATFATAQEALGQEAVVDLVAVLGYYALISMTINAFDIPAGQPVFGSGPVKTT